MQRQRLKTGMVAVLMVGAGITLGNVSQHYGEIKAAEEKAAALAILQEEKALEVLQAATNQEEESIAAAQKEEKETEETKELSDVIETSAKKLNLAFYFPEDAESEDIIDSYAGQVFQELMIMDLDWLADLYELSDISPSTMASRLGKSTKSIMGSYNPRDKQHKPNSPSSWVIHDWKKIHVNFIDGDGHAIDGFSNVKDILSMASVYTYYTDMMDVDTFAEYSRQLWKNSHSYSLSMGDLYYCSGCLNKTEEELVREAEEEEFASMGKTGPEPLSGNVGEDGVNQDGLGAASSSGYIGNQGVGGYVQGSTAKADGAVNKAKEGETETTRETKSGEEQIAEIETGDGQAAEAESESSESGMQQAEASLNGQGDTARDVPTEAGQEEENTGKTMGTIGGAGTLAGRAGASGSLESANPSNEALEDVPETTSSLSQDTLPQQGISGVGGSAASSSNSSASNMETSMETSGTSDASGANQKEAAQKVEKSQGKKTQYDCPGHVDLYIRVKILGLNEKNGLFSIAKAAEKELWEGWTKRNIACVQSISSQDWFDDYGLSVSSISLSNPLSNQEIESYMNQLPADTSVTRRNIIHFALSSVGRVPYYWGGKPAAPGYEGNHFGALIPADDKGRIQRGLDCSGWINWVYWSATGKRLSGESTSSLCLCGKQISRSELKPGDIIVRTGAGAHVVMFLSWNADGRMNVIHETSGSMNNVAIATMDAPWPYYRKLVE